MITGFSHAVQISVLIKAVGAGYILGLVFSFFTFLNAFFGKRDIFVFFRDVIFCVGAAFFTFLFSLKYNAGIVRFYILAGEMIGFCLFYIFPGLSLGNVWRKTAEKISLKTKAVRTKISVSFNKIKIKIISSVKTKKVGKDNKKKTKNERKNGNSKTVKESKKTLKKKKKRSV